MPSYYPHFANEETKAQGGDIITRNYTVQGSQRERIQIQAI